ncbi:MAG: tripartite tricarboxylate transporter substrate binding protein [Betaproteobacteria bacterium]|nr:tripartite tricarboxylate transporter substrate binding protein [Betaproteobacteria bacterium]
MKVFPGLLSLLILGAAPFPAYAQTAAFPNKPVRIVVPTPAGGPADFLARIIGQKMSDAWGQPVIVENRPGADTIIGNAFVSKAAPDGYTLLVTIDAALTMHQFAYQKLPYDPLKDFTPIAGLANSYVIVFGHPTLPANSMAELMALAKTAPGKYTFGWGTLKTRLIGERLSIQSGVKFLDVPYKGSAGTSQALFSGDVNFVIDGFAAYKGNLGKGRFKMLAVTGPQRATAIPEVPTLKELGFPGFETGVWLGLLGPPGVPGPVVDRINAELVKILDMKDIKDRLEGLGFEILPRTPQQFAELIRSDSEIWGKIIRDIGLKLD